MQDVGDSDADLRNRGGPPGKFERSSDAGEMRQRILQKCVVALKLLDRLFLTLDGLGQVIDGSGQLRFVDGNVVQAIDRSVNGVDLLHQRIVVPQQARALRQANPRAAPLRPP